MGAIFVVITGKLLTKISQCDESEYRDINDLFKSFNETFDIPEGKVENFSFDITQIDINRAKKKLEHDLKGKLNEENVIVQSGRRGKVWNAGDYTLFINGVYHVMKEKAIDIVLQLIYMSKHNLRQVEMNQKYDFTDPGFRLGFLYLKMKMILHRMVSILALMHKNNYEYYDIRIHLMLHHRAVKMHIDFQYFYWVMVRLDGLHKIAEGHNRTLPKKNKDFGGISIEGIGVLPSATPELPLHHIQPLDEIISKHVNFSSLQQGSLLDFLLGNPSNLSNDATNLDLTYLNYNTFKKIIETSKKNYNESLHKSHRRLYEDDYTQLGNNWFRDTKPIVMIALNMMRQSIYITRQRLNETLVFRQKFINDIIYHIGFIIGNVHMMCHKSDNLFEQLKGLEWRPGSRFATHFLWFLIIYEKLLALNTDVTELVKRAFLYQDKWLKSTGGDSAEGEGPVVQGRTPVGPTNKGSLPPGFKLPTTSVYKDNLGRP